MLDGSEPVRSLEHDDGAGFAVVAGPAAAPGADPGGDGERAVGVGVVLSCPRAAPRPPRWRLVRPPRRHRPSGRLAAPSRSRARPSGAPLSPSTAIVGWTGWSGPRHRRAGSTIFSTPAFGSRRSRVSRVSPARPPPSARTAMPRRPTAMRRRCKNAPLFPDQRRQAAPGHIPSFPPRSDSHPPSDSRPVTECNPFPEKDV